MHTQLPAAACALAGASISGHAHCSIFCARNWITYMTLVRVRRQYTQMFTANQMISSILLCSSAFLSCFSASKNSYVDAFDTKRRIRYWAVCAISKPLHCVRVASLSLRNEPIESSQTNHLFRCRLHTQQDETKVVRCASVAASRSFCSKHI